MLPGGAHRTQAGLSAEKPRLQYSDQLLEYLGGPQLPLLTSCGAEKLPDLPDFLFVAAWNLISGTRFKVQSLNNMGIAFVRQSNVAARQYEIARTRLESYVEGLRIPCHRIGDYLFAMESFEHCLSAICRAVELENEARSLLLPAGHSESKVFSKKDGSDLERICTLNNLAKHWNAQQAAQNSSAPLWITNIGLSSELADVDFSELRESIVALNEYCRQMYVVLPAEARARDSRSLKTAQVYEQE